MERNTRQRQAIRTVFDDHPRPMGPQEVLDLAQREAPNLGIATVYRTLKSLQEEGWLRTVTLPEGPTLYERDGLAHHHHFHCTGCGRTFDVHACPSDILKLAPSGFTLERHDVVLYGKCLDCAG
jgi:Fur family ferric uptake transcriptional regulator